MVIAKIGLVPGVLLLLAPLALLAPPPAAGQLLPAGHPGPAGAR